jgi:hypothetical protein
MSVLHYAASDGDVFAVQRFLKQVSEWSCLLVVSPQRLCRVSAVRAWESAGSTAINLERTHLQGLLRSFLCTGV